MKIPKDQPFWTSVVLHLMVLLALFLVTIVQAFKPKEKPHVFEMVDPQEEASESKQAAPQRPMQEAPVKLPRVPTPRLEERQPAKTQIINYRDFTKEHPWDKPKPRPSEKPRYIKVDQIDVSEFIISGSSSSSKPSPQVSPQQMSTYYSRLSSRIDAAWVRPPQLAGLRLAAKVVFDVSPSGQITNVQLRPGSGNKAFDQSILAAFRNASSAGPTPTGQPHTFSLPFRMGL